MLNFSQNNFINKFLSSAHLGYNTLAPTPKVGSTSAAASSQSRTKTVNEEATAFTENKEEKNGEEESKDE